MWTNFKVFIEFVTIFLCFTGFYFVVVVVVLVFGPEACEILAP